MSPLQMLRADAFGFRMESSVESGQRSTAPRPRGASTLAQGRDRERRRSRLDQASTSTSTIKNVQARVLVLLLVFELCTVLNNNREYSIHHDQGSDERMLNPMNRNWNASTPAPIGCMIERMIHCAIYRVFRIFGIYNYTKEIMNHYCT